MVIARGALFFIVASSWGCDSSPRSVPKQSIKVEPAPGASPRPFVRETCSVEGDLRSWQRADPANATLGEHKNDSMCSWLVSVRDGRVFVTAVEKPHRPLMPPGFMTPRGYVSAAQRGRSGVLVGFDHGEWGGSLEVYAERGTSEQTLLDTNVRAIVPAFGQVVVLAADASLSHGWVVEVLDHDDRFEMGRRIDLDRPPMAGVLAADGSVLIATGKTLLRLTNDFQVHPLLYVTDRWAYPVSIAVDRDGTAYVGMRSIVAEVRLSANPATETWLYPP